ncbi:MAG: hypothetical protein U0M06_04385, partial [Clostridia bacterium]|nr:hypothetical protein [Clostridia bacterium]
MYDIYEGISNIPLLTGIGVLVAIFLTLYSFIPFTSLFSKNRKKEFNQGLYLLTNEYHIPKIALVIALLVCTFVLIFSENQLVWLMDGKTDLRIAPEGTYCYYVVAGRDEDSNEYTLPAKIQKSDGTYYVENVYFSNGGYLYFNSYEYADFDETITDADQNGEFWEIKITNFKASPPNNMADYYELSFWRLFLSIVPSALMIIYALLLLFTKNPKYSEENIELQKKYYELLNKKTELRSKILKTEEHKKQNIS